MSHRWVAAPIKNRKLPLGGPPAAFFGPRPCPKGPGEAPDQFALDIAANGAILSRFKPDLIFSGTDFRISGPGFWPASVPESPSTPETGLAWPGLAWPGLAWLGLAWPGLAWPGLAWPGPDRPGPAWPGLAWPGLAWPDLCLACPGLAWPGVAWPGMVGDGCMVGDGAMGPKARDVGSCVPRRGAFFHQK